MFKILSICTILCYCANAVAQRSAAIKNELFQVPVNSWHLRVNPLAALDAAEPALSVGAEYRLKKRTALGLDIGYIFYSNLVTDQKSTSGIILKPSIRYYTSDNMRFYVEGALLLKQVNYNLYDWLGRYCVNEVSAYDELRKFTQRKRVGGIHFNAGRVASLSRKNNNVSVDYYAGIGLRYKLYSLTNAPDDACYQTQGAIFGNQQDENKRILPSPALGIRLLIKL